MEFDNSVSRKLRHLRAALGGWAEGDGAGFGAFRLVPESFPEIGVGDLRLEGVFASRPLDWPFLVGAMTGGAGQGWNSLLAEVCAESGVGLCLGSMRPLLSCPGLFGDFDVRSILGGRPLVGNIGVWQLREPGVAERLLEIGSRLDLDAWAVHVNPAQEVLQESSGECSFAGALDALEAFAGRAALPVLLKEVGCGLVSRNSARLLQMGLAGFDVAGAGGTSFPAIESCGEDGRLDPPSWVRSWGVPTAELLRPWRNLIDSMPQLPGVGSGPLLMASGGIRTGRDCAIAFALGADLVSAAAPVVRALREAPDRSGAVRLLATWKQELSQLCLLTGSRTPTDLRRSLASRNL